MRDRFQTLALSATLFMALAFLVPLAGAAETLVTPVQLHDAGSTGFGLHIVPEDVNAQPGQPVDFQILNQGSSKHNFFLCGDAGQGNAPPSSCHVLVGQTALLDPQATADVKVDAPTAAGTYWYYCNLPGHAQGGMAGTLKVLSNATTTHKSPGPAASLVGILLVGLALVLRRR